MASGPTVIFCRVPGLFVGSGLEASMPLPKRDIDLFVRIGPMGGRTWTVHNSEVEGRLAAYVTTGNDNRHGTSEDTFEAVDYQVLATHTRGLARRFLERTPGVD